MAMVGGSVSVADNGTVTSSGMAGALFSALQSVRIAQATAAGANMSTTVTLQDGGQGTVQTNMLQYLAADCNAMGPAIVAYIQANAVASISTSLGGLQTSAASGSATTAPATAHTIPIT